MATENWKNYLNEHYKEVGIEKLTPELIDQWGNWEKNWNENNNNEEALKWFAAGWEDDPDIALKWSKIAEWKSNPAAALKWSQIAEWKSNPAVALKWFKAKWEDPDIALKWFAVHGKVFQNLPKLAYKYYSGGVKDTDINKIINESQKIERLKNLNIIRYFVLPKKDKDSTTAEIYELLIKCKFIPRNQEKPTFKERIKYINVFCDSLKRANNSTNGEIKNQAKEIWDFWGKNSYGKENNKKLKEKLKKFLKAIKNNKEYHGQEK